MRHFLEKSVQKSYETLFRKKCIPKCRIVFDTLFPKKCIDGNGPVT